MGDLDSNPDIDDKEPIPLRNALEKAKPFLMAYEGIESHEEWEVHFILCCLYILIVFQYGAMLHFSFLDLATI